MAKTTGAPQVLRNLQAFNQRYKAVAQNVLMQEAAVTEQRLKTEAPWTDRTGNARRGLKAAVQFEGTGFRFYVAHQVPYGGVLEYGHQGRFSVLRPVLRTQWPRTKRAVARAIKEQVRL